MYIRNIIEMVVNVRSCLSSFVLFFFFSFALLLIASFNSLLQVLLHTI